jgi:hypothetical protein
MHIGYWWESQTERYRWEDQDVGGWTMDLREIGLDGVDWIDMAEDFFFSIKCWEILEWLHNWRLLEKGSAP